MELNGKTLNYRMVKNNPILDTFDPGEACDFREDDGMYHGGYKFIRRSDDGEMMTFETPNGSRFDLPWWRVLRLKNENKIRLTWDFNDPYPLPIGYEQAIN